MTKQPQNALLQRPIARSGGLLLEELDDETLVYDLKSHDVHCLNESALLVWKACDGSVTVADLAGLLESRGFGEGETLVWMTLERLTRSGLLDEAIEAPEQAQRYSRKQAIRAMGAAAGLTLVAPLVTSIVAPLAAQAASCLSNSQCVSLPAPNCTGLPICGSPSRCCQSVTLGNGRPGCRRVTC